MAGGLSSDLTSNLVLGILAPASSVRGVEGNAGDTAGDGRAQRRRARRGSEKESEPGNEGELESAEPGEHQLDRLA